MHHQRPPLDLFIQLFEEVRRFQILVVLSRKTVERQRLFDVVFRPIAELGISATLLLKPRSQVFSCLVDAAPVIDPAQFRKAVVIGFPRHLIQGVAQETHIAALPHRLCEYLGDGLPQTGVIVADNQLHTVHVPLLQRQAQLFPTCSTIRDWPLPPPARCAAPPSPPRSCAAITPSSRTFS